MSVNIVLIWNNFKLQKEVSIDKIPLLVLW